MVADLIRDAVTAKQRACGQVGRMTRTDALDVLARAKYTGSYVTHCNQGVPTAIEIPNVLTIHLVARPDAADLSI